MLKPFVDNAWRPVPDLQILFSEEWALLGRIRRDINLVHQAMLGRMVTTNPFAGTITLVNRPVVDAETKLADPMPWEFCADSDLHEDA